MKNSTMLQNVRTRELLKKHQQTYSELQIEDVFKYIFQSAFGCEHLVKDEEAAINYIKSEFSAMESTSIIPLEELDGEYSRASLSLLSDGMRAETLGKLFCLSAKNEPNGMDALICKLKIARDMVFDGELPFSADDFDRRMGEWSTSCYGAVHHSEIFRAKYNPHYRVISNRYAPFLPFFSEIDKLISKGRAIIAIEGGSASGKTTLAGMLAEIYDCNVFHMDDFFLRPEQRTPERLSEVGGNVDKERFLSEVLIPLSENREVCFRRFDCSSQSLESPITVFPKRLVFVEGAYSMHPSLAKYYDFSLFLDIAPECQRERIFLRNSRQFAKRFFDEWIPLEILYFSETKIKDRCDMTISVNF